MKYTSYFVILFAIVSIGFHSCTKQRELQDSDDDTALVNVNGKILYKNEIDNIIPKGLNPTDSTLAAEGYIKMWIKNELVYEKAAENLGDQSKIDELVENYRQSLVIYTYQEQLIKERLTKNIKDKELEEYYNANLDNLKLESDIIKGLFLKVPLAALQLEDLKKWIKQGNDEAIENIEKYSLQSAVIYDYFYDKWVNLDDVMASIPYSMNGNSKQFLLNNKNLEVQDSTYVYLLNIKEYMLEGSQAPFDYIKGQLLDIVTNKKKVSFIKGFEDDLYNTAVQKNQIKYYNK